MLSKSDLLVWPDDNILTHVILSVKDPMILFFYGEDTYRLNQKLRELKEKFISASLGDTNLSMVDGETATFDEIVRQILAMPFLSKKRLVIIKNLLSGAKKEVLEKMNEFLAKVPEATVFVLAEEGVPDRRTTLFKKLNQPKLAQEFNLLDEERLRRWVKLEIEKTGAAIEPAALSKLIDYIGSDLWRMSNEIQKLSAYSKRLTIENIELLVQPQIQSNIFDLMDRIADRNLEKSMKELYQLFDNGKPEHYILSMIVYQVRNLILIKNLLTRYPNVSMQTIGRKTFLHPFVIKKTLLQVKNFTLEKLKNIYQKLVDFDIAVKTGKIEPGNALNLLIVEIVK